MTNKRDDSTNKAGRQKKNTAHKRGEVVSETFATRQGLPEQESEGTRIQGSDITDQSFSLRGARNKREYTINHASLGEVLEHLANLETRFYSYVHSHQERLNTRHQDSIRQESEFAEEAALVRAKIQFLLEKSDEQEQSPESKDKDPSP